MNHQTIAMIEILIAKTIRRDSSTTSWVISTSQWMDIIGVLGLSNSRTTINRAIKQLKQSGLVIITLESQGGPNRYELTGKQ